MLLVAVCPKARAVGIVKNIEIPPPIMETMANFINLEIITFLSCFQS